jgi:hypothetical protein
MQWESAELLLQFQVAHQHREILAETLGLMGHR